MSKIDKFYFKWKPEAARAEINLGDSKETLLAQGSLCTFLENGETFFTGKNEDPWRVVFEKDRVSRIWYTKKNSFIVGGLNVSGEFYAEAKPILEENFAEISRDLIESKKNIGDDVLCILCTDYIISMIGLLKLSQ